MLMATEGLKISVNLNPFGFVAAKDSNCIFKKYIAKEELSLKVSFLSCQLVKMNPNFKILINIQIWIIFFEMT